MFFCIKEKFTVRILISLNKHVLAIMADRVHFCLQFQIGQSITAVKARRNTAFQLMEIRDLAKEKEQRCSQGCDIDSKDTYSVTKVLKLGSFPSFNSSQYTTIH